MGGNKLYGLWARLLLPTWLLACLLLGGSSGAGVLANGLLQIAAGLLIAWLLVRRDIALLIDRPSRSLLLMVATAASFALATLVPLPPAVWRVLPGRNEIADAFSLIGMAQPWLPISLSPDATIVALLSFLPPVATLLLVIASSPAERRAGLVLLAGMALVSVLFGVLQQASGYRSNIYLYEITSRGGAVGFFANRNHLATLCLMTMPFLAALAASGRTASGEDRIGAWTLAAAALLLLVIGSLVVQSRAGVVLLIPTLLACTLLFRRPGRGRPSRTLLVAIAITAAVAVLVNLLAPVSIASLGQNVSEVDPQQRRAIMELSWRAARDFLPVGSGLGAFDEVYRRYENLSTIPGAFINHAHNDYLELVLETGLFGFALLLIFVLWWVRRTRDAWRSGGDPIARAACISIGVLLAHSFVDFPGRTAAIACLAALCCGLASARATPTEPRRRQRERSTGVIMLGARSRPAASGRRAQATS